MALSKEEIAKILTKDVSAKTILVDSNKVDSTIEEYTKDGWKLVRQSQVGVRVKLTFEKVK